MEISQNFVAFSEYMNLAVYYMHHGWSDTWFYHFQTWNPWPLIKLIYSEKATSLGEISTVDLSYVVTVKSTVEILQNFVTFLEYMNFTYGGFH